VGVQTVHVIAKETDMNHELDLLYPRLRQTVIDGALLLGLVLLLAVAY
jgi:hypothetical protein